MDSFAVLLAHQAIQVTFVVCVALLVDRIFRQKNWSRARFAMWLLVLAKLLTPPVITSPTGIFSLANMAFVHDGKIVSAGGCGSAVLESWDTNVQNVVANYPTAATVFVAIWIAGVLVLFSVWGRRLWLCCRSPRSLRHECQSESVQAQFARCEEVVDELCSELGLAIRPRIVVTESNFGPAVYGLLHPRIVIPIQVLKHLSDQQLRPVLAHEIVHIRRKDTWIGLLQLITAVVWWFHPFAWIAIRRLSDSLEIVTDDDVVCSAGIAEYDYAHSLLSVIEVGHLTPAVTGSVGVFTCQVTESRIKRLIEKQTRRSRPALSFLFIFVLACLVLPGRGLLINQNLCDADSPAPISLSSHP